MTRYVHCSAVMVAVQWMCRSTHLFDAVSVLDNDDKPSGSTLRH